MRTLDLLVEDVPKVRALIARIAERNPRLVRRGFHMDAVRCRRENMSADEWEQRAKNDIHAHVIGERTIEAISAFVWGWDRRSK